MGRKGASTVFLLLLAAAWMATRGSAPSEAAAGALPQDTLSGDVLLPMPEMIARFQEGVPVPDTLGDGVASSRDELVTAFVTAIKDSSAAALRSLRLDVAEFAWLYFPESRYTEKPYELPPETLWMLMDQNGLKGQTRLLRRFGGRQLDVTAYACEDEPRREGPNTFWEQCLITVNSADGARSMRLFGSIMERGGRFKFVSMANDL